MPSMGHIQRNFPNLSGREKRNTERRNIIQLVAHEVKYRRISEIKAIKPAKQINGPAALFARAFLLQKILVR